MWLKQCHFYHLWWFESHKNGDDWGWFIIVSENGVYHPMYCLCLFYRENWISITWGFDEHNNGTKPESKFMLYMNLVIFSGRTKKCWCRPDGTQRKFIHKSIQIHRYSSPCSQHFYCQKLRKDLILIAIRTWQPAILVSEIRFEMTMGIQTNKSGDC